MVCLRYLPDAPMEQPLTLHWQSAKRYYTAMLTPDLFGGWVLVTDTGDRDRRDGRVQRKPVPDYTQGRDALKQLSQIKATDIAGVPIANINIADAICIGDWWVKTHRKDVRSGQCG